MANADKMLEDVPTPRHVHYMMIDEVDEMDSCPNSAPPPDVMI